MHLDILIDMKLLLCSATSPRIALAILAKQSAGFAFLFGRRKLIYRLINQRKRGSRVLFRREHS